jgi:hypothetical protein
LNEIDRADRAVQAAVEDAHFNAISVKPSAGGAGGMTSVDNRHAEACGLEREYRPDHLW